MPKFLPWLTFSQSLRSEIWIGVSLILASCSLTVPPEPQRVVRVKVLADTALIEKDPHWREAVSGLVEAASDYFEREFGIRLAARKIEAWRHREKTPSTAVLLRRLKKEAPLQERDGTYDLVIAFTGEPVSVYAGRARVDRIGNCHEGLGNYVISSMSAPFRYRGPIAEPSLDLLALIHELGHIFGAEHTDDTTSVMHENFDYRTEFDGKNREIILKNRFCPFGRG